MTNCFSVLDIFSGIGGFSLGLERACGFKTVAFCEIDPFCQKILKKHWPEVRIYHDVKTITKERLANDGIVCDVICGGFPCQDISIAGKGKGIKGTRSGLWVEFERLIGDLRPKYAIVENVGALLFRGFDAVLGGLAEIGYDAEWHCIPACGVGLPHLRERIYILAYPRKERTERCFQQTLLGLRTLSWGENVRKAAEWAVRPDLFESGLCRNYNGISNGVDRVGSLGNAVVPQIAELIARAIIKFETTNGDGQ